MHSSRSATCPGALSLRVDGAALATIHRGVPRAELGARCPATDAAWRAARSCSVAKGQRISEASKRRCRGRQWQQHVKQWRRRRQDGAALSQLSPDARRSDRWRSGRCQRADWTGNDAQQDRPACGARLHCRSVASQGEGTEAHSSARAIATHGRDRAGWLQRCRVCARVPGARRAGQCAADDSVALRASRQRRSVRAWSGRARPVRPNAAGSARAVAAAAGRHRRVLTRRCGVCGVCCSSTDLSPDCE